MSKDKHNPGMFFFAADWRSELTVLACSEVSRYLWFEMLLIMNESDPRGYLLINGESPDPETIAMITRTDPADVDRRLSELERRGVFSRTKSGVIYCRKMVRDEKKARISRENGKKGGNPTLCKQTQNQAWDNHQAASGINTLLLLNPDSRSPIPRKESKPSREESDRESPHCNLNAKSTDTSQFEEFWNLYPRKIAKREARLAYALAVKLTTVEDIHNGVKRYAGWIDRNDEPNQFIKHPATWLNKGCWSDELTDNQSKKAVSRVSETKDLLARFYARKAENGQTGSHPEGTTGVQLRISSLQEEHRRN